MKKIHFILVFLIFSISACGYQEKEIKLEEEQQTVMSENEEGNEEKMEGCYKKKVLVITFFVYYVHVFELTLYYTYEHIYLSYFVIQLIQKECRYDQNAHKMYRNMGFEIVRK